MKQLLALINSIYPISNEIQQHLFAILKTKEFTKKQFLLKEGQRCNAIYFIEKGLVRSFYKKDEGEVSSWFMKEGDFIISVESFFTQQPSYECLQALEDTVVHYIEYNELQVMYKTFVEFNFIGRIITEKYYTLSEQRLFSIRKQKAEDKYKFLLNHFPEIVQRVSSTHIASYLGISLETLSRVKSK